MCVCVYVCVCACNLHSSPVPLTSSPRPTNWIIATSISFQNNPNQPMLPSIGTSVEWIYARTLNHAHASIVGGCTRSWIPRRCVTEAEPLIDPAPCLQKPLFLRNKAWRGVRVNRGVSRAVKGDRGGREGGREGGRR